MCDLGGGPGNGTVPQNSLVSPNAQPQLNSATGGNATQSSSTQPGGQSAQVNVAANNRSSPGPSDENMKKAFLALGLPGPGLPQSKFCKLLLRLCYSGMEAPIGSK